VAGLAPAGEAIDPDNFSKSFDRIVASASVPRRRLHDLRHTHRSLLLKERFPINVVSGRLGYAMPGFTMAIHQHVRPGVQADAARAFAGPIAFTDFHPVEGSVGQACAGGIAVTPRQQSG
jgi:integrase